MAGSWQEPPCGLGGKGAFPFRICGGVWKTTLTLACHSFYPINILLLKQEILRKSTHLCIPVSKGPLHVPVRGCCRLPASVCCGLKRFIILQLVAGMVPALGCAQQDVFLLHVTCFKMNFCRPSVKPCPENTYFCLRELCGSTVQNPQKLQHAGVVTLTRPRRQGLLRPVVPAAAACSGLTFSASIYPYRQTFPLIVIAVVEHPFLTPDLVT